MNLAKLAVQIGESLSYASYGLRLSLIVVIVWSAFRVFRNAMVPLNRLRRDAWWDLSERPDGALSWSEVLRLVRYDGSAALQKGEDPLEFPKASRGRRAERAFFASSAALALVIGLAALALVAFVMHPFIPEAFAYPNGAPSNANAVLNLSGNLTALLALIAASISIAFTYHQLQAKVRADNRQEWLATVRTTLARTLALAIRHAKAELDWERQRIWSELDPERLKLELLLNPSEKDHRLLMFLVQRLSFMGRGGFSDIADAGEVCASIKKSLREELAPKKLTFEEATDEVERIFKERWSPITLDATSPQLVSYAMRLSHVVLKREWERVKWTR